MDQKTTRSGPGEIIISLIEHKQLDLETPTC